jgi:very-short-patch-repair endonuclease
MDKKEFFFRQIAKTHKKNYENYIVTGLVHRLNNPNIKFITQQHVDRPEGGRALTDLYFPQIDLHVEIDEEHHKNQVTEDRARDLDIVTATSHQIVHVDATKSIESINSRITEIVDIIRYKISKYQVEGLFFPWDIDAEYDPQTYIKLGYIDLKDKVAFRTSKDACNCFGHNYKGFQRGGTTHPKEEGKFIWFPKLYKNDDWDNSISYDGKTIKEKKNTDNDTFIKNSLESKGWFTRIVFSHVRGPLGDVMYRFQGEFKVDVQASQKEKAIIYQRTATRVKTYE